MDTISTPAFGGGRVERPAEVTGGVDLQGLGEGAVVEVSTLNSVYRIRVGEAGRVFVAGHPEHCPEMVEARGVGAVMATGGTWDRYVAPGMRMELRLGERRVFTSRVVGVRVLGNEESTSGGAMR
jgi:hypothetical protein